MLIQLGFDPVFGRDDERHSCFIEADKHVLLLGKTGQGKSGLISHYALSLIEDGQCVVVIDPHTELVQEIAASMPESRIKDALFFNPLGDRLIGLTPFEGKNRHLEIEALKQAIAAIYPDGWGPQTADLITQFSRAIFEAVDRPTLLHLRRMFVDSRFRKWVRGRLTDQEVLAYLRMFDGDDADSGWNARLRTEKSAPPLNKLNDLCNDVLKPILCQPRAFNFRRAIDEHKILLFGLAGVSAKDTAMIGSLVVNKLTRAILSRHDSKYRPPVTLIIDEFLSFFHSVDPSALLAESRKFGCRVLLSCQTAATIPREMAAVIFANTNTQISFRLGAEDAERMAREYADQFPASRLVNLSRHHFIAKTEVAGVMREPRFYQSFAPEKGSANTLEKVKRTSEANFGVDRKRIRFTAS